MTSLRVRASSVLAMLVAAPAGAQQMPGMTMPSAPAPTATQKHPEATIDGDVKPTADASASMPGMEPMGGMAGMAVQGMLGRYPMTRESSGTSWQPDSSPMRGYMFTASGWSLMAENRIELGS